MSVVRALPVSGDAFLYEANDLVVLVDGGRSSSNLANLLLNHRPHLRKIDVVICTHADHDHSGGLRSLLDHWKGPTGNWTGVVGEFWLPGRWQTLARRCLVDTEALLHDFITDVDNLTVRDFDLDGADDADDQLSHIIEAASRPAESQLGTHADASKQDGDAPRSGGIPPTDSMVEVDDRWLPGGDTPQEPDWLVELRGRIEEVLAEDEGRRRQFELARRRIRYRMGADHLTRRNRPSPGVRLLPQSGRRILDLIDTLKAIHDIARGALIHGVPIRWFDFHSFDDTGVRRGGIRGRLLPMNSAEQVLPISEPLGVLYRVSLTIVNRESLVFYVPGDATTLGLLFCADSRLGSGRGQRIAFPPYAAMKVSRTVMTAPHHGSQSNALAYIHAIEYHPLAWVRSDNGGTVGNAFKELWPRICTGCKGGSQPIRVAGIKLKAPFAMVGCPCVCP